ncbi:YpmS family protein [Alkalicoccus daliensis]|uniref:Uncharacterized protein YpmS n=1 Tax=Alkalicoccus daliensis TaxID=745820 RepID=A0A1H0IF78_9BACI|nr:YpmS family protein [Alkalicoccus daliensis]SDO30139.1 Uncharacterized protein YpmS [Alkalicoccus daliensis]
MWKAAFFILLALVIISIAGLWIWVDQNLTVEETESFTAPEIENVEGPSFLVSATREDANAWLQRELEEEEDADDFILTIDDAVYFETSLTVFGMNIPLEVDFQPEVSEDGNIWLREDGFRLGALELPAAQIFHLIGDNIDLPEWISVAPNESSLYLNLRELETEEFVIEAQSVDLENNDIEFRITAAE